MFRIGPEILVFMIPIVAILGGVFLGALKILKGNSAGGRGESRAEETGLIQDIHHGLQKMEERIEALETILLDVERSRGKSDTE